MSDCMKNLEGPSFLPIPFLDFKTLPVYFSFGYPGGNTLRLSKSVLLICFLLVALTNLHAQQKDSSDYFFRNSSAWLNLGLGKSYFGPTLNFGVSYAYKNNIFSIRYLKADEFKFSAGGSNFDNPSLGLKELGFLYGLSYRNGLAFLSASAGIAYVEGTDRGKEITSKNFEPVNISTVGLPFELDCRMEFTNYIGLGFSFYGDINSEKNYYGGMIKIIFGKF